MADLIDRKVVVKGLELLARHEDSFTQSVILGVVHSIKSLSAVDAVEVVRCKDCDYYEGEECGNPYIWMSDGAHLYPEPDHYCSYGERREENV